MGRPAGRRAGSWLAGLLAGLALAAPGALPRSPAVAAAPVDALEDAARAHDWTRVEELARERLSADPDDLHAHARLGEALLWRARALAAGEGLATELAASAVDRALAHLERARALPGVHELWLDARAEHPRPEPGLDAALRELARDGDPHAAYLWALRRPDAEAEAAVEQLAAAVAARPGRHDYRLALLARLVSLGRLDAAAAAWSEALAAGADASALAAWAVQVWPGAERADARAERLAALVEARGLGDDPWLGWYRAHALAQAGRRDAALAVFDAAAGERPPEVVRAHAALLLAAGRPADAAELLLPLAAAADWTAYADAVSAADALALARRFDAALAVYDALLAIERRDERAQHHRALTLWRAGQDSVARAAFAELLERWPGRSDLLNDAGLAALGAGRLDEAAALFERAAALPQSVDARENRAALALRRPGDDPSSWLAGVLAEEPERPRALVLRARARSDR